MAELQHWVVDCTTCGSPAEYHCNTCGDILCPSCREIHQKSRGTSHHSIVLYLERVEPSKLNRQCPDHPGHHCKLWCETCKKPTCKECVTSASHAGHTFIKLGYRVEQQRKAARAEFEKYSSHLERWEDSLKDLTKETKLYKNYITELGHEIDRSADGLCELVKTIQNAKRNELQEIAKSQINLFQKQRSALVNEIVEIKLQCSRAEDSLRSEEVEDLLQFTAKHDEIPTPPKRDTPVRPNFTEGNVNRSKLESMLGNITVSEKTVSEETFEYKERRQSYVGRFLRPRRTDRGDTYMGSRSRASSLTLEDKKLVLLSKAVVVTKIQLSTLTRPSIACTQSGQAWIRTDDRMLQLIDIEGAVQNTIRTSFTFGEMAIEAGGILLSSDTETLLFTDTNHKCVTSISANGSPRVLFKTKWKPWGLCCLMNGDIMVTFGDDGRVVQYSGAGKVVRELSKSLFRHPRSVAQNKVNKYVYVCDISDFCASGKVLTLDMKGKLQFEYNGSDGVLNPTDICTDLEGHVIITDCFNHKVHILDQNGIFLKHLLTNDIALIDPYTIDGNQKGYVWIGEWESFGEGCVCEIPVKVMKYLC